MRISGTAVCGIAERREKVLRNCWVSTSSRLRHGAHKGCVIRFNGVRQVLTTLIGEDLARPGLPAAAVATCEPRRGELRAARTIGDDRQVPPRAGSTMK